MRFPTLQSFRVQIYREAQLDLKNYREDSFALFDSAEAGALLGAIVAGCVIYDLFQRFLSWLG
jgi:hypothetical protein